MGKTLDRFSDALDVLFGRAAIMRCELTPTWQVASNSFAPSQPLPAPAGQSIAVFPGGGTQGLMSLIFADAFEKETDKPFHKSFDFIVSTSVGAINSSLIWPLKKTGQPLLDMNGAMDVYLKEIHGTDAFKNNWLLGAFGTVHDISGLEKVFESHLGDTKLSDYEDGLYICVSDLDQKRLRFISSDQAKVSPHYDFYMRDLLRGAISAPIKISPKATPNLEGTHFNFLDAAISAPNPALYFLLKSKAYKRDIALTNFGTGNYDDEKIDLDVFSRGVIRGAQPLFDAAASGTSNTHKDLMGILLGEGYVNLNIDLSHLPGDPVELIDSKRIPEVQALTLEALNNGMRTKIERAAWNAHTYCVKGMPQRYSRPIPLNLDLD